LKDMQGVRFNSPELDACRPGWMVGLAFLSE
jgi:hypothetical protein